MEEEEEVRSLAGCCCGVRGVWRGNNEDGGAALGKSRPGGGRIIDVSVEADALLNEKLSSGPEFGSIDAVPRPRWETLLS